MSVPLPVAAESGWILFELDNGPWAISLEEVAEVGVPGSLRRMPGSASPVVGLAECRGRLRTVLDLARLLDGTAPAGPPALILLAGPREPYALYLTAVLRLGTAEPGDDEATVSVDGRAFRRITTASLFAKLAEA